MKSKELLLKHLALNDCEGYITSDGRLYKAIIDALNEALTIPVVVDMLPKKNSKDFKDWLIGGGYTKTRIKDVYIKGDSSFTTDVLYRHFCNVLTFGN